MEAFVEKPYNVLSLTLDLSGVKTDEVTKIKEDLAPYATRKYIFEESIFTDINIIEKELNTKNLSILFSILITAILLVLIWFLDKKRKIINFGLYIIFNVIAFIYCSTTNIGGPTLFYRDEKGVESIITFFLKADINKYMLIVLIINIILSLIGILLYFVVERRKNKIIMQSKSTINLLIKNNEN